MKLIDERGRLFGKINLIDLAVVLVIVLAIAGVALKKTTVDSIRSSGASIEYTMKIKKVRSGTLEGIESYGKGAVSEAETGKALGTITKTSNEPAETYVVKDNGEYSKTTIEGKYDVYVTIKVSGNESPDGIYTASGKQLFVGDTVALQIGDVQTTGEIQNINIK